MNITGDARLEALLFHLEGEQVHDIYNTLVAVGDKDFPAVMMHMCL